VEVVFQLESSRFRKVGLLFAWLMPKRQQDLDRQVFVQMYERSWKMKKLFRGSWLLFLALAATGCGGNDPQETDALSRNASASSEQSSGVQKFAASDQIQGELWRLATTPSVTGLQASGKVAVGSSDTDLSSASPVMTKAVATSPELLRFLNPQAATHTYASAGNVLPASVASGQPGPNVRLSVNVANMPFGKKAVSLSWTSSGVTTCSASGGWTGVRNTWGRANAGVLTADTVFSLVCSGPKGIAARSVLVPVPAGSGTFMGQNKILIGGMLDKATVMAAPFDVRYAYVHSRPAPAQACYVTCAEGCNAGPDGGWWGCWGSSSWNPTSGTYITWWNNESATASYLQKPMIQHWTWYSLEDLAKAAGDLNRAAGRSGNPDYAGAINNPTLLRGYLDDYRFFLQKMGTSRTMIQLEPDFWGFVRSKGAPHVVPAAVRAASRDDCAGEANSAAGLASCLIRMTRKYAPASAVGIHTSCWDWDRPDSPTEGPKACAAYYRELGAGMGDFIASDAADRDAEWAARNDPVWGPRYWWDDAKFNTYLNLIKTVTEGVGKPMVIWQIPLGNEWQNNTMNNWQDNKVKYMFDRIEDLADAHVAALLFGAGHHEQTSTETDDHYMLNKAQQYYNNGGVRLR
jgi:hypothetical protein